MRVRRRWLVVVVSVVLAVGVIAAGAIAGQRLMARKQAPAAGPSPEDAANPSSPNEGELAEFRHDQLGLAISYPATWARIPRPDDPNVLLVASEGRAGSFLLRAIPLGVVVPPEKIPEMRQLTDQMVTSGTGVKLLAEPRQIELAGLTGYYYLYTFPEGKSGRTGAHAHYFLVKGDHLIVLVFQALPQEEFPRLAPLFDRMAESFRVF